MEYITAAGMYCTTNDVKVPFRIPEFSKNNIIPHKFHVDNNEGESGIGYDMIIGRDLMVQVGFSDNFKRQLLQWDGDIVLMKKPSVLLGQIYITSREMSEVVIQNAESVSTVEATVRFIKPLTVLIQSKALNR